METPDQALVPVTPDRQAEAERSGKPVPKIVLARSLDEASSHAFVHVDNRGRVRSPARYRAFEGLGYASIAATLALPVIYGWLLGPLGLVLGGGLAAFIGARMTHGVTVQRAVRLLSESRVDEAEPMLDRVVGARWGHRRVRALAHHNLGLCRALRGDFQGALDHVRTARSLYARSWSRSLYARTAVYFEIALLVDLDRAIEARALLDQIGAVPEGEYLRISHWGSELYVCMAEGACALSDDDLHERGRKGLSMTAGATLLGLTAWAFHARDDADMAALLLGEAFDRLDTDRLERTMPRLYAWMVAHRPARGALGDGLD